MRLKMACLADQIVTAIGYFHPALVPPLRQMICYYLQHTPEGPDCPLVCVSVCVGITVSYLLVVIPATQCLIALAAEVDQLLSRILWSSPERDSSSLAFTLKVKVKLFYAREK